MIPALGVATITAMNRKPLMGALLLAAASLIASGAYAQNNNASPQGKANAAGAADKAGDKDKDKKADDKKADDKGDKDKGKSAEDREARKAKQHEAQKEKLKALLKGPMSEATKQEIRRHAERVARLERIKSVATDVKDTATADKATALLTKENERHDKWMGKHASEGATTGTTPTPAATTTGGAK